MEEQQEERNLENFLKWGAKLGISDCSSKHHLTSSCLGHSLCVSHFPDAGGRGLAAVRDLRKGELILRVPKSALMMRESLLKDQKLSQAVDKHPSLSSAQVLAVCLLYELGKGKHSWWHPYLLQLPRGYDMLETFGQFETQALQVNVAIWETEKARAKAEIDWKEAIALMKELQLKHHLLTFEAWLWASATISSRTMHIPWDNAGCLCPVGDFFNYIAPGEDELDSEDSCRWRSASSLQGSYSWNGETPQQFDVGHEELDLLRLTDGGYEESISSYCFYARRNYKKGEQVLLSYGTYTNLELLEHYGFLLERNPNEKVFIPLDPEIYSLCSWPKDLLYIHQNGKPSFALLSSLRLWLTPPKQRRSVGHLAYSGSQLSVENEIIVMGWIAKNCKVLLETFVTSIEEDKLLLQTIDKMQGFFSPTKSDNFPSEFKGEAYAFLDNVGLVNAEGCVKLLKCRKIKRRMDRWKLAVQWRFRYKRNLADCISYCSRVVNELADVI